MGKTSRKKAFLGHFGHNHQQDRAWMSMNSIAMRVVCESAAEDETHFFQPPAMLSFESAARQADHDHEYMVPDVVGLTYLISGPHHGGPHGRPPLHVSAA